MTSSRKIDEMFRAPRISFRTSRPVFVGGPTLGSKQRHGSAAQSLQTITGLVRSKAWEGGGGVGWFFKPLRQLRRLQETLEGKFTHTDTDTDTRRHARAHAQTRTAHVQHTHAYTHARTRAHAHIHNRRTTQTQHKHTHNTHTHTQHTHNTTHTHNTHARAHTQTNHIDSKPSGRRKLRFYTLSKKGKGLLAKGKINSLWETKQKSKTKRIFFKDN